VQALKAWELEGTYRGLIPRDDPGDDLFTPEDEQDDGYEEDEGGG